MLNGQVTVSIPSIGVPDMTGLLGTLTDDPAVRLVRVFDNGAPAEVSASWRRDKVEVVETRGYGIYRMWNEGARRCETPYLLTLNDDVGLAPGAAGRLVSNLGDYAVLSPDCTAHGISPDPEVREVRGTYRQGGILGFAFLMPAVLWPGVDERFTWWYGDDDLVAKVSAAGYRLGVLSGEPVWHKPETSAITQPWTWDSRDEDAQLFRALHGG